MDLINRYVYAVTKELPEKQREDIEKELRSLIEDMLEQQGGAEPYEVKLQKVLKELGDPEVLAGNYRETKRYLVGPQNYHTYLLIVKIVFGAVFLGVSIATVIGSVFSTGQDLVDIFAGYLAGLFSGLLQAFAWVTIAFALAERNGMKVKKNGNKKENWSPIHLPPVPRKETMIPPVEAIVSIVFSTLFMTVLYFAPQLFAVYFSMGKGDLTTIPLFDIDVLMGYRWLFAAIFIFSVAKEVLKLVSGRWTLRVSVLFAALSIVSMVLTVLVFVNPDIWNPNFAAEVMQHVEVGFDLANIGTKVLAGFIVIVVAAGIYEIATALYKGLKYNR